MNATENTAAVTIEHKTRSTRPRVAGARAVATPIAEVRLNGELVDTIIYSGPLLERLDRQGITREQYAAQRAAACVLAGPR